jgi:signal transduction histidine kinase/GAF domain-containing protein
MNDERLAADEVAIPATVKSFLRRFRSEIIAEGQRDPRRADAIELMIDGLLGELDERHQGRTLGAELELAELVAELSWLRACATIVWDREHGAAHRGGLRALHQALDRVIVTAAARQADDRDRMLAALDRISSAVLEAPTLDDLLGRLLHELMHAAPTVDTAAILLREGDRLYARAAVGLEEDVAGRYAVTIGEGFCGMVAAARRPLELRSAYLDAGVSDAIRRRRVLALSGVPLVHDNDVIGVAHMGSLTAHEFSAEERRLFSALASRATVEINHHMLRARLAASEDRFKRIADEREHALAKLEGLLAASPVGIAFLDHDLRYVHVNHALAAISGRPISEHLGRRVREVLPDAAAMEPMLHKILESGEPVLDLKLDMPPQPGERRRRTFLGSYFPVRSSTGVVFGLGGVVTEVTEHERAREDLETSRRLLQSIVDHAPLAIFVKDEQGRVVLANAGAAEALASSPEGSHDGDGATHALEAGDAIVRDEGRNVETEEAISSSHGVRTFLSSKFPVPGPDDQRWLCGILQDITERKRMEDQLRDAVRAREDLIAVVSHDLRNPLGTITLGSTLLLTDDTLEPRTRKHIDTIQRSARRMERLIDDLLDMATIHLGRMSLQLEHVSACSLVADAVEAHQALASDKGIHLRGACQVENAVLACDPERIQRVFSNLIGNALKFCRPGDTIHVIAERIARSGALRTPEASAEVNARSGSAGPRRTSEASAEVDHVRYAVIDSGPGIDPVVLPFLFDPYWSAPEHAKRGAGLGLYICKGIVSAHGGTIRVESELGAGTRFFFTLPIER